MHTYVTHIENKYLCQMYIPDPARLTQEPFDGITHIDPSACAIETKARVK